MDLEHLAAAPQPFHLHQAAFGPLSLWYLHLSGATEIETHRLLELPTMSSAPALLVAVFLHLSPKPLNLLSLEALFRSLSGGARSQTAAWASDRIPEFDPRMLCVPEDQ